MKPDLEARVRVPECPAKGTQEEVLENAVADLRAGMARVCCPHHALLAAVLLGRALVSEAAEHEGIEVTAEEVRNVARAYEGSFAVDLHTSSVHTAAMFEALATVLLLGRRPPPSGSAA